MDSLHILTILPAGERIDGKAGAIGIWVRNVYGPTKVNIAACGARVPTANVVFTGLPWQSIISALSSIINARFAKRRLEAGLKTARELIWLFSLRREIRASHIIHLHNRPRSIGVLSLLGYRGKIILHMHNSLKTYVDSDSARHTALIKRADMILFCSDFLRHEATRMFTINDARTLYNGVDESRTTLLPPEASGSASLAFIGRHIPEKGIDRAITAAYHLARLDQAVHLDIVGAFSSNASEREFERYVRGLALRLQLAAGPMLKVSFSGLKGHAEVLEILAKSNVLIMPCRWDEPFGMVAAEALSVGTPVVATYVGGLPEIIQAPVQGVLLPRDAGWDDWTEALRMTLSPEVQNETARAVRGVNAQSRFGWSVIRKHLASLLNEIEG